MASAKAADRAGDYRASAQLFAKKCGAVGVAGYQAYRSEQKFRAEVARRKQAEELAERRARTVAASRTDVVGQVIGYATSPGQLSYAPATGSPYTQALVEHLQNPEASFIDAFSYANSEVLKSTDGLQRPFFSSTLNGDVFPQRMPDSRIATALIVDCSEYASSYLPEIQGADADAKAWATFFDEAGIRNELLHSPARAEILRSLESHLDFLRAQADLRPPPRANRRKQAILSPNQSNLVLAAARIGGLEEQNQPTGVENTLLFFIYAGLGFSSENADYFVPSDASGIGGSSTRNDLIISSISMRDITATIQRAAAASIIVMDTGFQKVDTSTR